MDADAEEAAAMLKAMGYTYIEASACWINKADGRVISAAKIAEHDTEWLARWITGK